jgi:hypothetical protein
MTEDERDKQITGIAKSIEAINIRLAQCETKLQNGTTRYLPWILVIGLLIFAFRDTVIPIVLPEPKPAVVFSDSERALIGSACRLVIMDIDRGALNTVDEAAEALRVNTPLKVREALPTLEPPIESVPSQLKTFADSIGAEIAPQPVIIKKEKEETEPTPQPIRRRGIFRRR